MERLHYQSEFEKAWIPVRRRVGLVRLFEFFRATAWIIGILALAVLGTVRFGFGWSEKEWLPVSVLLGLWLVVGLIRVLFTAPSNLQCLMLLDEKGGWRDRFSSAWEFAKKDCPSDEELAHLKGSLPRIEEAVRRFPESYDSPGILGVLLTVFIAIAIALLPFGRPSPKVGEMILTPEMREVAAGQAANIRRESEKMKGLSGLTKEELDDLEELRVSVDDVAGLLAESEELAAGEMLKSLESRARAAEKLAEKLGLADNAWASPEMLREMSQHADTVDLALSIKDKAAEPAAFEASHLKEVLDRDSLTEDIRERLSSSLEQIVAAATDVDEKRPVGERFGNASRKLLIRQAKTAAREFEELAKHFHYLAERDEAREKLERLASNLREAGAEVSGSELERMEQVSSENSEKRAIPSGLESIEAGSLPEDLQKMLTPQVGASGKGQPALGEQNRSGDTPSGEQKAPIPGMDDGKKDPSSSESGKESIALKAPIPGESAPNGPGGAKGQGSGASEQAQDGSGDGGILSAPIPGEAPAIQGDGAGMSLAGNPGATQGQGGDQAGTGTAAMIDNETDSIAAAQDGEVNAQVNAEGESSVRAVEGRARRETASRTQQEVVAEFLSAEEQALDGKSIPLSRREHVIRYFSAIRKQFEEAETKP